MKPEIGETDMDDKVYDPRVLFAEVGLLITEARTPEISKKGRIEGPHCPSVSGQNEHECDRHKEQCRKASNIINQQEILWQNKIPMRIDVLLFPDCKHGQFESSVVEGASLPTDEHFELLERWDVQLVKKRSPERMEGFVKGRIHLQAVRSYLHFSQLSSWLISMRGAIPFKTVYRIYAPGESVGPSFSRLPEVHNFPSADLGDVIMRTTCAFLPRQQDPIVLLCRSQSPGFESHRRTKKKPPEDEQMLGTSARSIPEKWEPVPSTSKYADEMEKQMDVRRKSELKSKQAKYGKDREFLEMKCQVAGKPPYGPRSKVEGHSKIKPEHSLVCPMSITPKRKVDQLSPTMQDMSKSTGQSSTSASTCDFALATKPTVIQAGAPPNYYTDSQNPINSRCQETPTQSPQHKKPATLCVAVGNAIPASKRLPSPKVLVTASSKPEPSTFKKRCLDFEKPDSIVENEPEFDDFSKVNEFNVSDICDLIKPPSLGELEAYLSSLSNKAPRKQRIQDIPTTKCRFYMDDCELDPEGDKIHEEEEFANNVGGLIKNPTSCVTKSLSERSDCVTPSSSGVSKDNNHVKNLFVESDVHNVGGLIKNPTSCVTKSLSERSDCVTSPSSGVSKDNNHVKNLFVESDVHANNGLSSSCIRNSHLENDIEDDIGNNLRRNSQINVEDSRTSKSDCNETRGNIGGFGITDAPQNCDLSMVQSINFNEDKKEMKHCNKQSVIGKSENIEKLITSNRTQKYRALKDSKHSTAVEDIESTINGESSPKSTGNSSDISNGNCQPERLSHKRLSTEINHRISKKERTLTELSIPCHIGAVDNAMTTLAHNLESMDIDDRPYTPYSRNSSPTLDHEVEKHLSPKPNVTQTLCEPTKVPERTSRSSSLTPSPETCDTSTSPTRGLSLCKQLLRKEFQQNVQKEITCSSQSMYKSLPSPEDIKNFQFLLNRSASAVFNSQTGLPSRSSPAPIKKISSNKFDYDCSLTNVKAIKNAISCSKLTLQSEDNAETIEDPRIISTSAPAATNCLLGNFEESVLNGRIEPVGVVDGFSVEIGAGGTFCPKHVSLPVAAYFFQLSDDNAPSPYLGHVNLEPLGRRGYHIPRTGTVQITLFNPNKTVVKMFVVMYDLSDMPANCQTFLRQRTLYMPVDPNSSQPSFLRYLIHLRFQSTKSGKIYLHTDIRLIFARDKFEFDPRVANYELRSFTEGPENPKFSPKK